MVHPMLLGIEWMDPNWLLDRFGTELFWISLLIVFVECGLFFPILPGDTLLFALGLFIATGQLDLFPGPPFVELLIAMAALAGGRLPRQRGRLRDRAQDRPAALRARRPDHQAQVLRPDRRRSSTSHGNKALVIGRFVPFVRTYITVVAGVTRMDRRRFFLWSLVGAVLWVLSISLLGFFLGDAFPGLGESIDKLIIVILAFSVIPIAIEWWRHRRTNAPGAEIGPTTAVPTATSPAATSTDVVRRPAGQPWTASSWARVSTDLTSRPTSASGFSPAGERSIAHTTTSTTAPSVAQRAGRVADGATGRDHVLDDGDPSTGHVGALGELGGAVLLGLLAHEQRRQPGPRADHRGDRDAAELEAAEQLGVLGQQVDHLRGHPVEQAGLGLEEVLVEVGVGDLAGAEGELPGQAADGVDVGGEGGVGGHGPDLSDAAWVAWGRAHREAARQPRPAWPTSRRPSSARCRRSPCGPARSTSARASPTWTARQSVIEAVGGGARRRRQPVRPRHRHPLAAGRDRAPPAAPLRPRPSTPTARSSSPPGAPRPSPRPCSAWSTRATRWSCSSPTTTPTSRCSTCAARVAARSRCGRRTSAPTSTSCAPRSPTRTRVILLNTPHNPTGTVLTRDELQVVADLAIEHDVLVVTDEVYEHLVFDDAGSTRGTCRSRRCPGCGSAR